jgi:hypothetical protein
MPRFIQPDLDNSKPHIFAVNEKVSLARQSANMPKTIFKLKGA